MHVLVTIRHIDRHDMCAGVAEVHDDATGLSSAHTGEGLIRDQVKVWHSQTFKHVLDGALSSHIVVHRGLGEEHTLVRGSVG